MADEDFCTCQLLNLTSTALLSSWDIPSEESSGSKVAPTRKQARQQAKPSNVCARSSFFTNYPFEHHLDTKQYINDYKKAYQKARAFKSVNPLQYGGPYSRRPKHTSYRVKEQFNDNYLDGEEESSVLLTTSKRPLLTSSVPTVEAKSSQKKLTMDDIKEYITGPSTNVSTLNNESCGMLGVNRTIRDINLAGRYARDSIHADRLTPTIAQAPLVSYKLPVTIPCKIRSGVPSAGSHRSRSPVELTRQMRYLNSPHPSVAISSPLPGFDTTKSEDIPYRISQHRKSSGFYKSRHPTIQQTNGLQPSELKVSNAYTDRKRLARLSEYLDSSTRIDTVGHRLGKRGHRQVSSISTAQMCDYSVVFGSRM